MTPLDPQDDELELGRRLSRLPQPRAPRTLAPRVMAAVRTPARRPLFFRPWFIWPRAVQAGFVAALVSSVAVAVWLVPRVETPMNAAARIAEVGPIARAVDAARDLQATVAAARMLAGAVLSEPLVLCFLALVLVMTAACAAFGTMLGRMANVRLQS